MGRKSYGAEALDWCINNGWDVVAVVTDNHQPTSPTANTARKYNIELLDYESCLEKIESEVGQKREEIDQKRSEMLMRRDAIRKVHKENPEARPSQEVREAMQKAMREEQQELRERMERMNKNRQKRVESEYLLILHEILSDEQYQTYLEQRDEIRREIRSQLRQ